MDARYDESVKNAVHRFTFTKEFKATSVRRIFWQIFIVDNISDTCHADVLNEDVCCSSVRRIINV